MDSAQVVWYVLTLFEIWVMGRNGASCHLGVMDLYPHIQGSQIGCKLRFCCQSQINFDCFIQSIRVIGPWTLRFQPWWWELSKEIYGIYAPAEWMGVIKQTWHFPTTAICFTSTLVVMRKRNTFSCLHSLHSANYACEPMQAQVAWKHTCITNTEQACVHVMSLPYAGETDYHAYWKGDRGVVI